MNAKTRTCECRRQFGSCTTLAAFSPLLAELLASDRVDRSAFCSSLELGENLTHHCADLCRSTGDCRFHSGSQLLVAYGGREVLLERRTLCALFVGEIRAAGLVVHLDRLATLLDRLPQYVDHIVVLRIAPQLDLAVLDLGKDGPQQKRGRLVLRFSRGIQVTLQPREKLRHVRPAWYDGSSASPYSACACGARSASRNDDACGDRRECPLFRTSS